MKFKSIIFPLVLVSVLIFTSCGKDDPIIPNEEELITTVTYSLTPTGGGPVVTMSFLDLDGDGGTDPTIVGGTLQSNQSYTASLELLNETENPTADITEEIEEEAADHQFFFQSDIASISINYNDMDPNGDPIGLSSVFETGPAASGTLTITLRHEPDKSASGVSDGDITNAGGETDIEVNFPIDVQ